MSAKLYASRGSAVKPIALRNPKVSVALRRPRRLLEIERAMQHAYGKL